MPTPIRWLPTPIGGCAPAKPAKSLVIQDKGCRALGGCAPAKPVKSLVVAYSIGGCLPRCDRLRARKAPPNRAPGAPPNHGGGSAASTAG